MRIRQPFQKLLDLVCLFPCFERRVDQGSEFVPRDMNLRPSQRGVVLDFSQPGKPTDNAYT